MGRNWASCTFGSRWNEPSWKWSLWPQPLTITLVRNPELEPPSRSQIPDPQKPSEIINVYCCYKPLIFRVIHYAASSLSLCLSLFHLPAVMWWKAQMARYYKVLQSVASEELRPSVPQPTKNWILPTTTQWTWKQIFPGSSLQKRPLSWLAASPQPHERPWGSVILLSCAQNPDPEKQKEHMYVCCIKPLHFEICCCTWWITSTKVFPQTLRLNT